MAEQKSELPVLWYDQMMIDIGKRECGKVEMLDWIFNHVKADPQKIPVEDWPCFGAIRLLIEANRDYPGFLALWKSTIPNQTQLKLQERAKDDGRACSILDQLEARLAESANLIPGEPHLPPGTAGPGGEQPVSP